MLLMIDNYDSFTYNLVQYLKILHSVVVVHRNDEVTLADIEQLNPQKIIISPGPGRPENAGITIPLIRKFSGIIPILGICLGHQAIAQAHGANIVHANTVMHGKTSQIQHSQNSIFHDIPNNITATRYHSLLIDRNTLPKEFDVIAWTENDEIMGIQHRTLPLVGLQFHPESILTEYGNQLLQNFLSQENRIMKQEFLT